MNLNSEIIINTVKKIQKDKKTMNKNDIENKYKDFKNKYPKLWLGIIDDIFTIEKFKELVNIHNMSYTRSKGDHKDKQFQSDKNIGENLARQYLYPKIGTPSQKEKNEVYRKMLAKNSRKK